MIIRERSNEIIMITQHDHALISGLIAENVKDSLFHSSSKRKSVEIAIREHDRAWMPVDKHPILNDKTKLPFSFMDLPASFKTVFYKHGIDEVEKMDFYAALLCSAHYVQFMSKNKDDDLIKTFIEGERAREQRLKSIIPQFHGEAFQFHFNLLKFCDNVSLYMCLNEPGTMKDNEHFFYKDGIHSPFVRGETMNAAWEDTQTVTLSPFPFRQPFCVFLKQKVVSKDEIVHRGIAQAYYEAPYETIKIRLTI